MYKSFKSFLCDSHRPVPTTRVFSSLLFPAGGIATNSTHILLVFRIFLSKNVAAPIKTDPNIPQQAPKSCNPE